MCVRVRTVLENEHQARIRSGGAGAGTDGRPTTVRISDFGNQAKDKRLKH